MLKKLTLILFLSGFLIFINGCGGDGNSGGITPTPVSKINFSGRVIDRTTGNPVIGATIKTNKGNMATSDSNGNFNIQLNSGTSYIISTEASGYKGSLSGGLTPSEDLNNYDIYLTTAGSNEKPVIKDI